MAEEFDEDLDVPEATGWQPDASITRKLFLHWRDARRGTRPAEDLTNAYWISLIKARVSGYQANTHFDGPDSFSAGPVWCCDRFGQSVTELPDGRTFLIGGEHEDHYDPDFYIYNDVIVQQGGGEINILGYPVDNFPPTDFHTTTRCDDQLILVGSLGYPDDRRPGTTQVLSFDPESFEIRKIDMSGQGPGWIHSHSTERSDDGRSLIITGGLVDTGQQDVSLQENIDDWNLSLSDFRWTRLTQRQWPQFELAREDGEPNRLWELSTLSLATEQGRENESFYSDMRGEVGDDVDLAAASKLYIPDMAHERLAEEDDEYGVTRIRISGVVVRYVEDMYRVRLIVEGELPQKVVDQLVEDLRVKLENVERTVYLARRYG